MINRFKKNEDKCYEIIVPATSANLGPGFDTLGISFDIFNHFIVEKSDCYKFIGVKEEYANDNNLVIQSAKKTYEYLKHKEVPFSLEIIENVPISRGLGSSATCILAGIISAMLVSGSSLLDEEIVALATEIEGHPDNVVPAYYGGLTSAYLDDKKVNFTKYEVSSSLCFTVLIPPFAVKTEDARSALPKELPYKDIVYSLSRVVAIPLAFKNGDVLMLKDLLSDKIHEPYRYPLIKDSSIFKEYAKKHNLALCISGSGSTLLLISNKSEVHRLEKVKTTDKWQFIEVNVNKKGTTWVEK